MSEPIFESLAAYQRLSPEAMRATTAEFLQRMRQRRTIRDFAPDAVPDEVLEQALAAAATAPSGANQQPWHFAVVRDPQLKHRIRMAAEEEERAFYSERAPDEWLAALQPLGTDASKPFLETAPCLIAIFAQQHGVHSDGSRRKHYYVSESVGIATGMLITALHLAGVGTLTHTPSPMKFLNEILERPSNERPYILLVVGYPADDAQVPQIKKKSFSEYTSFH